MRLLPAIFKGIAIYAFMVWLYVIANLFRDNFESQFQPFSQFIPLHENVIALLAFFTSLAAYILWEWKK